MPPHVHIERLHAIKTLSSLVAYLRDELDWPIETEDIEDMTFDYKPEEFGLEASLAVQIKEIKQIRPLTGHQPWGIFWINFEKKRLPVVVMRRILRALVIKKRTSTKEAERKAWLPSDLLFISAYGEESDRAITFAHFVEQDKNDLAELRVLGWDDDDTPLKYDWIARTLTEKMRWQAAFEKSPAIWRETWRSAFTLRHCEVITTSQELALELAALAKRIRGRIRSILRMEDGMGQMRKLMRAFQQGLIHDLNDDDFADMFAQTVTYGLFSIAVRRTFPGLGSAVSKDDVPNLIFTSPFLKEMLGIFLGLKSRKGKIDFDELGLADVTDLLQSPDTHMEAILRDFGNRTQREDPVIHFYELFLTAYDKAKKVQRGVFYTPQPVVSYIVRSVHELLQTEFGLEDGLADITTWGEMIKKNPALKLPPLTDEPGEKRTIDPNEPFVQILDFATGTGTFLVEVIDVVHKTLLAKWEKQGKSKADILRLWNEYVPKNLLPRLYGYELMMAPYAIAHMKIGLKLSETGYLFATEERARIYLTNALEPKVRQLPHITLEALAHEAAAVNEVKWYKRFTVVIGNPPYSNFGQLNKNPFILGLLDDYKRGLNEKKINLDDDFVKFIRFSESQLKNATVGIHGMITNNAYLDGLTHRRMRQHLKQSFPMMRVLNLHGSSKKKEKAPDGTPDENVFDITVGVAIGIFCRVAEAKDVAVSYTDCWGSREAKTKQLADGGIPVRWQQLEPMSENFYFVPKDFSSHVEYRLGWSISDAFAVWQNGIKTDRDELFFDFEKDVLGRRMREFYAPKLEPQFREKYQVVASSSYDIEARRQATKYAEKNIHRCLYRPMDFRWLYYEPNLTSRPAEKVMKHMLDGPNLGLITTRQTQETWGLLATSHLCGHKSCAAYDINSLFPMYIYEQSLSFDFDSKGLGNVFSLNRHPNFAAPFLQCVAAALKLQQKGQHGLPSGLTPEDIFHYIYAVLYSPTYRARYAEFLKIDFPRVPITSSIDLFRSLAKLGGELVSLHLLESPNLEKPITEWLGGQRPEVEKVSYEGGTVWVDKAQSEGFSGVSEEVWNFHIGGYQVCEKWLKDRKGRVLSKDDLTHYQKIVVALRETIRLMGEIDQVIEKHGGWPLAFQTNPDDAEVVPPGGKDGTG